MNVKFKEIVFNPVGVIHTPYEFVNNIPFQPSATNGVKGTGETYPGYSAGLKDINRFSFTILLYNFHLSKGHRLELKPFS